MALPGRRSRSRARGPSDEPRAFHLPRDRPEAGAARHRGRRSAGQWRPVREGRISIMPELQEALDALPPSGELRFLLNDYGKPFASAAAFGNKFADWCDAAALQPDAPVPK